METVPLCKGMKFCQSAQRKEHENGWRSWKEGTLIKSIVDKASKITIMDDANITQDEKNVQMVGPNTATGKELKEIVVDIEKEKWHFWRNGRITIEKNYNSSNIFILPSVFWDFSIETKSHTSVYVEGAQMQDCLHFQQTLSTDTWQILCLQVKIKAPTGLGYTVTGSISWGSN